MIKKHLKMTANWPIWILYLLNLSWVILVKVLTVCSIGMVQLFGFVFELRKYHKITQIQKDRYMAFLKSFTPDC